jgi:amidohydrolase
LGINALDAAAAVINAVNAVRVDVRVPHSAKATICNTAAGKAFNVIPDAADLTFDLRAQENAVLDDLRTAVKTAVLAAASANGSSAEVTFSLGYPAASFDPGLVAETAEIITAVCGSALPTIHTPGGEDFHRYSVDAGIRTAFVGLGGDMGTGLHTPGMIVDVSVLPAGAKILAGLAGKKLR